MRRGDLLFRTLAWLAMAFTTLAAVGCVSLPGGQRTPPTNDARTPAVSLPLLRLSPASLGRYLSEHQVLSIEGPGGEAATLDVLLEIDDRELRMALLQTGRVMARLQWDGSQLQTMRAPGWPEDISEERILSDMQMALWPLSAVQASLPPSWSIEQHASTRYLRERSQDRVVFASHEPGHMIIDYLHSGWRLAIRSRTSGPTHLADPSPNTGDNT